VSLQIRSSTQEISVFFQAVTKLTHRMFTLSVAPVDNHHLNLGRNDTTIIINKSSDTAKRTARPSCLVGVMTILGRKSVDG